MPFRKVLRLIPHDWANLRVVIAGKGSGWSCSKTPSFRALQELPSSLWSSMLIRASTSKLHLGSEALRKRAKLPVFFEISISSCTESRTRVDSWDSQVACREIAPTACLTTRPTRYWKFLRVNSILRLAMRETTVNVNLLRFEPRVEDFQKSQFGF